jgi:hypothetical protein
MGILIDILILLGLWVFIRQRKWCLFGKEISISSIIGSSPHRVRTGALLAIIAALAWSLSASWFSAHCIIDYNLEADSYFLCFATVFCAAFLYAYVTPQPCSRLKSSAVVLGTICSLSTIVTSCCHSDDTFMYWKMRQIPSQAWLKMASDLEVLGKEITELPRENTYRKVDARQLPKSLDVLGTHSDYCLFYSGVEPCIIYGSHGAQGRQWGLMIGSNHLFKQEHPEVVKRILVANNTYFFVDPN